MQRQDGHLGHPRRLELERSMVFAEERNHGRSAWSGIRRPICPGVTEVRLIQLLEFGSEANRERIVCTLPNQRRRWSQEMRGCRSGLRSSLRWKTPLLS